MIIERINESHAIQGFDMSIKLNKPKIEEKCLQILALRKFKDLLYQREKRNTLNEDTFLKLMGINNEAKKRSEDPDQYLQWKEISTIIKDYVQQNYEDENVRKQKSETYLKLLISPNSAEDFKSFEEFYEDASYDDEKFLKVHLEYFQAHLLKIDKENQLLIDENKRLKVQFNEISAENKQLKSKSDDLMLRNEKITAQSVQLLKNTENLKVELEAVKSKSDSILRNNEELKVELAAVKSQSTQLLQNTENIKLKIDAIMQSNEQIKFKIPQIKNLDDKLFQWLSLSEKSSIIGDGMNGETQNLMCWIKRKEEKSYKLNLIYRGSRDGFTAQAFHSKCDNKSPTISFIQSDQNKIFGGYTQQTWEGNGVYKPDDKAFLFSFTNNEKYPIKIPEQAIYPHSTHSVIYGGGCDIAIYDNCNTSNNNYSKFPTDYSCSKYPSITEESKTYLAGAYYFKVIEIEVFTLI